MIISKTVYANQVKTALFLIMLNKKVSSRLLLKWEFNILYDYFSIITIKFELKLLL